MRKRGFSFFASGAATLVALSAGASGAGAPRQALPAVPADVRAVFAKPVYKNATWGLRVLEGSKVLVDLHPERKFYIGSVRKVFTVGELLDAVGPEHRYDTPVYRVGRVVRGVLSGNLVLVASGDLTMGGRTNPDGSIAVSDWDHNEADSLGNAILTTPDPLAGYERLARAVRSAGITRIEGEVIVDDRLFQPFDFRGQFDLRPVFVNDDAVDIAVTAGRLTYRPVSAALAIRNRLSTGAANSPNTLKIVPEFPKCIGTPGCSAAIEGALPAGFTPPLTGTNTLVQTVRITQPSNYARTVFIESLRRAGVSVGAKTVEPNPVRLLPSQTAYDSSNRVAVLQGMTYAQDAKLVLKISYNIGADTSLMLFGVTRGAHTMPAALQAERKNLAANFGIAPYQYSFFDGSGGGETTATSAAVTRMLQELERRPAFRTLYDDLPILAVDGSLAFVKDFEKVPSLAGAAGHVRAKTGTYVAATPSGKPELKSQALGGYITTKSGKHVVYELVVNDVPIDSIADVIRVFQDEGTISAMLWRDY